MLIKISAFYTMQIKRILLTPLNLKQCKSKNGAAYARKGKGVTNLTINLSNTMKDGLT